MHCFNLSTLFCILTFYVSQPPTFPTTCLILTTKVSVVTFTLSQTPTSTLEPAHIDFNHKSLCCDLYSLRKPLHQHLNQLMLILTTKVSFYLHSLPNPYINILTTKVSFYLHPLPAPYINIAPMATKPAKVGDLVHIIGWGRQGDDQGRSAKLKIANNKVVDRSGETHNLSCSSMKRLREFFFSFQFARSSMVSLTSMAFAQRPPEWDQYVL